MSRKTITYIITIFFIGLIFYLGIKYTELPTLFDFSKTEKTKGTVVNVEWTRKIRGYQLQFVTYEVEDSIYTDQFKAGKRQGIQSIGDEILIEYSIDKPEENEVIGFFRKKHKPFKIIKLESEKYSK